MKSFKQFLAETKWSKYLYHATYDDFDPKDIKPGSHFGTLHAAIARGRQTLKDPDSNRQKEKLKIHVYSYERKGKTRGTYDTWNEKKVKKKRGVDELVYRNRYEDPGSRSSIIWDTKQLKHVHTFKEPKMVDRDHADTYLGMGDNESDKEYLQKKGRTPLRGSKKDPKRIKWED
jgi:hypothetical protein